MGVNKIGDILRANANGFVLSPRGITTNPAANTIGIAADADGALQPAALHANSLVEDDVTNGQVNINYLKDSTKPFTISGGVYRGVPVFSADQTLGKLTAVEVSI